ncbi:glycosyl hydrolase [Aspergillus pseudoustus]|uniref:Glycosyl hydrolase n=1 Tax=Aspergillus pseudoustus TaxID=1810923 RepID=A0ABR4IWV6_9EURO
MMSFTNPIIPGFFPDPSCIRVGDTFYLANSSFQFFPGIPIHKSKDLINWEHIGNAISRPSQISLSTATTKINNAARGEVFTGGLYAPALRHHNGVFYIVCTMLTGSTTMQATDDFQPENFIISTRDIEDPNSWSELVPFDFYGIDPSLFFADDGRVYVQGSWIHGYTKHPATVIRQAEIDLATGALLSEPRDIWAGATQKCPEGPHLYAKDGWYYLLIAEGGTHRGHQITIARSKEIWGPYESNPSNPVLTAEASSAVIQCVGHGDLFQDAAGEWWCVMLARREYGGSYPLGRETYMVPVTWKEGEWPVFETVQVQQPARGRVIATRVIDDQFEDVLLQGPKTVFLRTPELGKYSERSTESGRRDIVLTPSQADLGVASGTMAFVGQRQTALDSAARVIIPLWESAGSGSISYGLTVYKDTVRYVALEYNTAEATVSLKVQEAGKDLTSANSIDTRDSSALELVISSTVEKYTLECVKTLADGAEESIVLGEVSCEALSGDDFTGTVYAIYAHGDGGDVSFRDFQVRDGAA